MVRIELYDLLSKTQEYIAKYYAAVLTDEHKRDQLKSYIEKFILDGGYLVHGFTEEQLIDRLYSEMVEYSILTPFVAENMMISSDVKQSIRHLKEKVNNSIFAEWCETLNACQDGRTRRNLSCWRTLPFPKRCVQFVMMKQNPPVRIVRENLIVALAAWTLIPPKTSISRVIIWRC